MHWGASLASDRRRLATGGSPQSTIDPKPGGKSTTPDGEVAGFFASLAGQLMSGKGLLGDTVGGVPEGVMSQMLFLNRGSPSRQSHLGRTHFRLLTATNVEDISDFSNLRQDMLQLLCIHNINTQINNRRAPRIGVDIGSPHVDLIIG